MLSQAQLQAVIAEGERPIREWLKANGSSLHGLSLGAIVAEVYRAVPQAAGQGRGTIEFLVNEWASVAGVSLAPGPIPPGPAAPSIAERLIIPTGNGQVSTGVGDDRSGPPPGQE